MTTRPANGLDSAAAPEIPNIDSLEFYLLPKAQQVSLISQRIGFPISKRFTQATAERIAIYFQSIALRSHILQLGNDPDQPEPKKVVIPSAGGSKELDWSPRQVDISGALQAHSPENGPGLSYMHQGNFSAGSRPMIRELANAVYTGGKIAMFYRLQMEQGTGKKKISIEEHDLVEAIESIEPGIVGPQIELDDISFRTSSQRQWADQPITQLLDYPDVAMHIEDIAKFERFAVFNIYVAELALAQGLNVEVESIAANQAIFNLSGQKVQLSTHWGEDGEKCVGLGFPDEQIPEYRSDPTFRSSSTMSISGSDYKSTSNSVVEFFSKVAQLQTEIAARSSSDLFR